MNRESLPARPRQADAPDAPLCRVCDRLTGPIDAAALPGRRRGPGSAQRRLDAGAHGDALHGCVEIILRDGEVWGERHRFDIRHAMAVMTWIEQRLRADDEAAAEARLVAGDFDAFLEILRAGGEGAEPCLAEPAGAEAADEGKPRCIQVRFVSPQQQ